MNCPRCSVAVPGPGNCPWCGYTIDPSAAPPATAPGGEGTAPPAGWQAPPPPAGGQAPPPPAGWQQQPPPAGWQQAPPPPPGWQAPPGHQIPPGSPQYGAPHGSWQYGPPPTWKGAADGFPYAGPGALASPWRRLGARVIDYLIFIPVFIALLWPVIADVAGDFDRISRLPTDQQSAEIERTVESAFDGRVLWALAGVGFAVFLYEVAMLAWRGATVGKLALGLRVVPQRDRNRPAVPTPIAALRTGLPALVGLIPFFGPLAPALDALWCLWDPRRQTLHDKVASTVVIRTR